MATPAAAASGHQGYTINLLPVRDSDAPRDRMSRTLDATISSFLLLFGPAIVLGLLGKHGGGTDAAHWWFVIGFGIGSILYGWLAPRYLFVYNSEFNAYVTQNMFGGRNIPYGPGLHASHWWERRNKKGNYSLKLKTHHLEVEVQTQDLKITFKILLQYRGDIRNITNYIGVQSDDKKRDALVRSVLAFVGSSLTIWASAMTGEEARSGVEGLNLKLAQAFMRALATKATDIERKYGITVVSLIIEGTDVPDAVEEARDAEDEAERIFRIMARMEKMTVEELKAAIDSNKIKPEEKQRLRADAMVMAKRANYEVEDVRGTGAALAGAALAKAASKGKGH